VFTLESIFYKLGLFSNIRSNNYDRRKQLENAKYFKYFCSILIEEGMGTCEIKSRIVMAKVSFNKKKNLLAANWIKISGRN
jgi:hypothetical protein